MTIHYYNHNCVGNIEYIENAMCYERHVIGCEWQAAHVSCYEAHYIIE
jgi:hypothetical protein